MNEPVDPRVLAALRSDRDARAPDDVQSRVAARLGIADPVSNRPAPRGPAASSTAAKSPKLAMLALAFMAGGGVGAFLYARLAKSAAPTIVYVDRPSPSPRDPGAIPPLPRPSNSISARIESSHGLPEAPMGAPHMVDSTAPAEASRIPIAASLSRGGLSQLDGERALLDTARRALVSDDRDAALAALDRHAKAYPHPLLGEEHDALLIQVLARGGRTDEARARGAAFRRQFPESLLLPAVEAAIASSP